MRKSPHSQETHDEGYFASFTDLLVGILFIFIILLMIVANNFQQATETLEQVSQDLETARNEARDAERDAARDAERDKIRDAQRDAERDAARDKARDIARDAEHDAEMEKKLADSKPIEPTPPAEPPAPFENKANAIDPEKIKQLGNAQRNIFHDSRAKVLQRIVDAMNAQGYTVKANTEHGVLMIPEEVFFDSNQANLSYRGEQAATALATALSKFLPCISPVSDTARLLECGNIGFPQNDGLDAIFVDDYPEATGSKEDRLLASVQRTIAVLNALKKNEPFLYRELRNTGGLPILNIKVNQKRRDPKQQQNRPRVEKTVAIWLNMRQPTDQDLRKLWEAKGRP